ncbi:MAG TPA: hypothetical protein VLZ75_02775 [Chitinophagales bacterium]|nr:hypothetical protein [Chitinophagales bacterium]
MKKLLLIIAVAGISFGATSCKKERTCQCTDSNTGVSASYELNKGKLSDQKQECERKSKGSINCSLDLL